MTANCYIVRNYNIKSKGSVIHMMMDYVTCLMTESRIDSHDFAHD